MAKQVSIIKFEGSIDDFSFYNSPYGYRVRKKTVISRDRILNDPAFKRTRENSSEFAQLSRDGKVLRHAVLDLSKHLWDHTLNARVIKQLTAIRNLDTMHPRGRRTVAGGIINPEGKALLKDFDFNREAQLQSVLQTGIDLDPATGTMRIENLDVESQLLYPSGATHVRFRSGIARIDFSTGKSELQLSNTVDVALEHPAVAPTVVLTPSGLPQGTGVQLHLLLITFYQVVNGVAYPLCNGKFNALGIVEVI